MAEAAKRLEIMKAYVEKQKRAGHPNKNINKIRTCSPIRVSKEQVIGHVSTSAFGMNKSANFSTDKWYRKGPVIAGESQTAVQKRLSNNSTASYRNKARHSISSQNRFEFLEEVKANSHLQAETQPQGSSNWTNSALLRQSLRSPF